MCALFKQKGAQEALGSHDMQDEYDVIFNPIEEPAGRNDKLAVRRLRKLCGLRPRVRVALQSFCRSEDVLYVA